MFEIRQTDAYVTWFDRLRKGETLVVLLGGGDKRSQPRDIQKAIALSKVV